MTSGIFSSRHRLSLFLARLELCPSRGSVKCRLLQPAPQSKMSLRASTPQLATQRNRFRETGTIGVWLAVSVNRPLHSKPAAPLSQHCWFSRNSGSGWAGKRRLTFFLIFFLGGREAKDADATGVGSPPDNSARATPALAVSARVSRRRFCSCPAVPELTARRQVVFPWTPISLFR